jgi:chemotaxis protein CheZ
MTDKYKEFEGQELELLDELTKAIEENNPQQIDGIIATLASSRQEEIFHSLNEKAYVLQKSIKEFLSGNNFLGLTEEELPDAMDRLKHVIGMTDEAANKTIDATEDMRDNLDVIRKILREEKLKDDTNEELVEALATSVKETASSLNEILLAQSYQDLSGQMIKKVLMLIEDVQDNIIELIIMIGDIKPNIETSRVSPVDRLPLAGPSIPGDFNVVGSQTDVDDLFDSLA